MGANVAERVFLLAKKEAEKLGLILWDVKFVKEGASYYLRIFIDKENGVGIDDCSNLSHAMDPILDEADPIDKSYYLEVCSTGLMRELTRPEHFEFLKGREIIVSLYKAIDKEKTIVGILKSYENEVLTLELENKEITLNKSDISKIKLNDGIN